MDFSTVLKTKKVWFFNVILLILLIFFLIFLYHEKTRKHLTVVFLDVGQGDSIFIETPNGNQILIDAGPNDSLLRGISTITPFYDKSIDLLIATHFDLDHVGGFPSVFDRFNIKTFVSSEINEKSAIALEIYKKIEKEKIDKISVFSGDRILIDQRHNIFMDVFWPDEKSDITDRNDSSIIIRLVYGETSFLFTGDASIAIENKILDIENVNLQSSILKAGHHGSKTSTSENFLIKIDPQYVIISAGKDNKFGHPSKEVIDILQKNNKKFMNTADLGNIFFKSDGQKFWFNFN